jgi:hypothetical protein
MSVKAANFPIFLNYFGSGPVTQPIVPMGVFPPMIIYSSRFRFLVFDYVLISVYTFVTLSLSFSTGLYMS